MSVRWRGGLAVLLVLALVGCADDQSALAPRGPHAEQITLLSWIMFSAAGGILALVVFATAVALSGAAAARRWLGRDAIIVAGGIVFPAVTLSVLLIYGFALMRAGGATLPEGDKLRIAVVGEQWWWRVTYVDAADSPFESANEIRIPVGRPIEIALTAADVIHSFWVPNLAGKLDMIPGRTTTLSLAATTPGVSRGQCAEYCGGAHALMSFQVVAMAPDDFAAWSQREAAPAVAPRDADAQQGQALFLSSGCGGCHTVRGTAARGTIGPDLTHVGGRLSLAAATLPNSPGALRRWITDNQHVKPENRMPPFRIFSDDELAALAAYLYGLK